MRLNLAIAGLILSLPLSLSADYYKKIREVGNIQDTGAINYNFDRISREFSNSVHKTSTETIRGYKYFIDPVDFGTITGNAATITAGDFQTVSVDTMTAAYSVFAATVSGNVGIGTAVPETKLEVQALEGADAGLTLDADDGDDNADTWVLTSQASDNDLVIKNHTTEVGRITDAGIADLPLQSAARASRNGDVTNGVGTSATKVALNAESFDIQGEFDSTTNNRFVATRAGIYSASGCVESAGLGAANVKLFAYIYKNGAEHARNTCLSGGTGDMSCCVSDLVQLSATEYIELYTQTNSGAAKNLTGGASRTFLSVRKEQ